MAVKLSLLMLVGLCAANEWSYNRCSDLGPANWPDKCAASEQKEGSPIDLCGAQPIEGTVPTFTLANWDTTRSAKVYDNGHTVQLNIVDNNPTTTLGKIADIVGRSTSDTAITWTLQQMHLHWGRNGKNAEGSEHYLQGVQHAMEAHFVHFNPDAGKNVTDALSSGRTDALLVVGIFFDIAPANQDNDVLHAMAQKIEGLGKTPQDVPGGVNLNAMFDGTGAYYAYRGSLTTPTCAEQVTWVVMKTPKTVSEGTLQKFKSATMEPKNRKFQVLTEVSSNTDDKLGKFGNYRPLQKLGNRTVYISSGSSAACVASPSVPDFSVCKPENKEYGDKEQAKKFVKDTFGIDVSSLDAVKALDKASRANFAKKIAESLIVDGGKLKQAFLKVKQEAFDMALPATGTKAAPKVAVNNWGQSALKAVLSAATADSDGFQGMGLGQVFQAAKAYAFLMSVDRMTDAGDLTNSETFEFDITIPDVLKDLVVKTYTEGSSEGVDVTQDGGSVTHLGNGVWRVNARHTSAFSGEIDTSTGGSSLNNAAMGPASSSVIMTAILLPLLAIASLFYA